MMHWSPQQEHAIAAVSDWYRRGDDQVFYLAGYAGTGKTTIANHLVENANAKPCYGAYTGKAAQVMRNSGCDGAATLHSLIYKFERDAKTGKFKKSVNRAKSSKIVKADLIVVDECSMVDEEIGNALCSFEKPILVLGDPGQLPPVKGGGFFTSRDPDAMLTEIHRQAEGNPIIRLATEVRQGRGIDYCRLGESAVVTKQEFRDEYNILDADQVLVGTNKTRISYNTRLRELKGITTANPVFGDRLVCLKNDRELGIFNGGIFTVDHVFDATHEHPNMIGLYVSPDEGGDTHSVRVRSEFFTGGRQPHWTELKDTQQFTYGYALTVHKSQGSQWNNVVLFDESFGSEEERRRWLYTGITRAAKSIIVVR